MKLNHYSSNPSESLARPCLLFEIRLDVQDVRSGYRGSENFLLKAQWVRQEDGVWTPDMVERVDGESLRQIEAPSELEAPADVEERMMSYLLRYHRLKVWRNYPLGIYSAPLESRHDFIQRCMERFLEQRSERLRNLRELYTHRFGELEKKALESVETAEMNGTLRSNLTMTIKTTFGDFRESLSRWFVRDDYQMMDADELDWSLEACPDVHDRLADVKRDLVNSCNGINSELVSLANQVETHEISPNHSDIEVAVKGVLWE